jgi:hypothetical protein
MNAIRSTDLLGIAIWLSLIFGTWLIAYSRSRART